MLQLSVLWSPVCLLRMSRSTGVLFERKESIYFCYMEDYILHNENKDEAPIQLLHSPAVVLLVPQMLLLRFAPYWKLGTAASIVTGISSCSSLSRDSTTFIQLVLPSFFYYFRFPSPCFYSTKLASLSWHVQ